MPAAGHFPVGGGGGGSDRLRRRGGRRQRPGRDAAAGGRPLLPLPRQRPRRPRRECLPCACMVAVSSGRVAVWPEAPVTLLCSVVSLSEPLGHVRENLPRVKSSRLENE